MSLRYVVRLGGKTATTHYDIFSSPVLASTVAPFLAEPDAGDEDG